jgi:hypothetical protein
LESVGLRVPVRHFSNFAQFIFSPFTHKLSFCWMYFRCQRYLQERWRVQSQ